MREVNLRGRTTKVITLPGIDIKFPDNIQIILGFNALGYGQDTIFPAQAHDKLNDTAFEVVFLQRGDKMAVNLNHIRTGFHNGLQAGIPSADIIHGDTETIIPETVQMLVK